MRTTVCPECDSTIAPGRFACSWCGTLAASVASAGRGSASRAPTASGAVATAPVTSVVAVLDAPDEIAPQVPADADADADPDIEPLVDEPDPMAGQSPDPDESAAVLWPADAAAGPWPPEAAARPPEVSAEWPARVTAVDWPAPMAERPRPTPAGAYLPPSAILPPAEDLPLPVLAAAAPAEPVAADAARGPSESGIDTFGLAADAPAQLIAAGAAFASVGFLLPWADVVIGSQRFGGGFFDQWGLAGPGHIVVLCLLLGLCAMALAGRRLPSLPRPGIAAIAVASLLAGLVWPYVFASSFEPSVGVFAVAAGALVIAAGGGLDRLVARHAGSVAGV
jgi:hypothetical protein